MWEREIILVPVQLDREEKVISFIIKNTISQVTCLIHISNLVVQS